jgi:hypothetical protein
MSLVKNATNHWQLPDGGELYSGDLIELYVNNAWIPGRIEFRPRRQYILILDNGQEFDMSEDLTLRWREKKFFSRNIDHNY